MVSAARLSRHFRSIVECLDKHGVGYVLIGGIAAMLHDVGIEETLDVDVVPKRKRDNLRALARALTEMDARLRVPDDPEGVPIPIDERTFRDMSTMTFVTRFGPFDILFEPDGGGDYEQLRARATVMHRYGIDIDVASIRDLVTMKRASGREKDLDHLELLLDFLERQDSDS